ncbi:ATP-binding protein [Nocardioides marmoriginsengisoli]|uniref:ATP-binding protein n=1 Tax=Nocardioides marmoriginsengisoli TaxID=661483 RepID=UPI0016152159|nr:ATP-binding protein [Nocardioides marmoriginsengisoli]
MSTLLAAPLQGPVSLSLPFSAESAGAVRRALVSWLAHQGSSPVTIHDARLVATELVANSIRHATPLRNQTLLVRWRREGDDLVLSVCDGGGSTEPRVVTADYDAERGRGLAIVEALSLRWWTERTRRIHVVHVLIPLA